MTIPTKRTPFAELPALDLPAIDHSVTTWWQDHDVFRRTLARTAEGPKWVFYEGPPTANGSPGTHHVEARVFKDIFPRYRTMKGYSVPRRAGWDCHGLPVELAVEKELGFNGKPDIEKYGIAEFNERCRASVLRHVGEFETLTTRMGYWIDLTHPYETMSPEYIDSVWWSLKQIYNDGRLSEDYRVAPYCTRCGTTLSDHEVAQGYEVVSDPSVYVRLPLLAPLGGFGDVELLVWTTTPWTLVSNTAVAVNPLVSYVVVAAPQGRFVVAEALIEKLFGEGAEVLHRLPGSALAGLHYRPPFDLVEIPDAHKVVVADYVTTGDGTGLVHQAPAFGADDLTVCRANNLPIVNPVAPNGHFVDEVPLVGGLFFKDANAVLIDQLRERGLLFRYQDFEHSYPHCWRCHTPLIYYAQLAWYIRTTQIGDALQRENERTNWFPDHIKHGRYGDWLNNNIDWALSRSRYWGTPLPLWRCQNSHVTPVGSRAELAELVGSPLPDLDPHRPFIDELTFDCPQCGHVTHRLPEVIDAWYDSGSMPFAQLGYPYVPGSVEEFENTYPAQYICEAIDQTRGWFYTLMAVGTLVFDRSAYENVVCLGHIMAEDGRKMSKHLGNILAPIPLMDSHGADALRWFMACSGSPWSPRFVGPGPLEEITRKVLATYWNSASFFALYASHDDWRPGEAKPVELRPVLDRWVVSQVHLLAEQVDERLENYDTAGAGRLLSDFVDELSNWYIRRSRQRFWKGDQDAFSTLYHCLEVLTRLLAPIIPFITEEVWQQVIRPGAPETAESVHLATWPVPARDVMDPKLAIEVAVARTLAEAGRAARKKSKVRIRQPLGRALVSLPEGATLSDAVLAEIADELNVKHFEVLTADTDTVLDVTVKPNFRQLGNQYGNRTPLIAKAIQTADPNVIVAQLRSSGAATVSVDGDEIMLSAESVVINEVPRTGWIVESQRGVTIALDTEVSDELAAEGLARDAVRVVQQARKEAGLDISDRITLSIGGSDDVLKALSNQKKVIAADTLATSIILGGSAEGSFVGTVGSGIEITVTVARS